MAGTEIRRCGWVAIAGPPNAGKSTLLNAMLGQKVSIVTPRAQTTRSQIVGILTEADSQMVFMDMPGLPKTRGRLNKAMSQAVWQSLRRADVLMPVIDGNCYVRHPEFLERDLAPVADVLANDSRPMVIVVNKVDMFADKSQMLPLLERISGLWPQAEVFPASALARDGLDSLKKLLRSYLPEGNAQFPEDQVSTSSLRFMAAESIREKLFLHLRQEVPYMVGVAIEQWEEFPEQEQTIIHAVIMVTRPSHKAMVIGQRGITIKAIGSEARREIIDLVGGRVHLELWVKVCDQLPECEQDAWQEAGFAESQDAFVNVAGAGND